MRCVLPKIATTRFGAAFEIGNSQTTLATSYTPANLMGFNNSANALSPNGSTLNYLARQATNGSCRHSLCPDFIGKLAFEPGCGHYEIKGLVRLFRDRIATTAEAPGSTNVTAGGGIGWAAILPIGAKLRVTTRLDQKIDFIFEGWSAKASAVTALPIRLT